jgi:hypothetical protein
MQIVKRVSAIFQIKLRVISYHFQDMLRRSRTNQKTQIIKLKLSRRVEGDFELLKRHYVHATTTATSSTSAAFSACNTIT